MMLTLNNITTAEARGASKSDPMEQQSSKSLPAGPRRVAPSHPGVGIGIIIEDIGLSIREAAMMMGVSHNALANLIKGASAISPEMAVRLGAFMRNGENLRSATEFWMRMQLDYDAWHALDKMKAEAKKIKAAPRLPGDPPPGW
jgi:addiction module HigA family antidote